MLGHQRDRLRDIECRAAAHADHRIGAVRLVCGGAGHDLPPHRIAGDIGKDGDIEAAQIGEQVRQQRQRRDPAIGHQQRSFDALTLEVIGDELARAGPEMDGRRKTEALKSHGLPVATIE